MSRFGRPCRALYGLVHRGDQYSGGLDVAAAGDTVLVTNGVYETGGRMVNGALTNRVAIAKPLIVRSVNGPEVTIIEGAGPRRCGDPMRLFGNERGLDRVHADQRPYSDIMLMAKNDTYGGGIFCEPSAVLSNCVLTGNSAYTAAVGRIRRHAV